MNVPIRFRRAIPSTIACLAMFTMALLVLPNQGLAFCGCGPGVVAQPNAGGATGVGVLLGTDAGIATGNHAGGNTAGTVDGGVGGALRGGGCFGVDVARASGAHRRKEDEKAKLEARLKKLQARRKALTKAIADCVKNSIKAFSEGKDTSARFAGLQADLLHRDQEEVRELIGEVRGQLRALDREQASTPDPAPVQLASTSNTATQAADNARNPSAFIDNTTPEEVLTFPKGGKYEHLRKKVAESHGTTTVKPADELDRLMKRAEALRKEAKRLNQLASTCHASFLSQAEMSIITAENMSRAQWAQGVANFFRNLGSLLLDLASIASIAEDIAKGDFNKETVIHKIDSIYEALKDAESGLDTLADQVTPTEGTGYVNDAVGGANAALETNPLTDVNSVKSDVSDVLGIIKTWKDEVAEAAKKGKKAGLSKKLDKKAIGQLVGRIAKGFADMEIAKRQAKMEALANDMGAEATAQSGAYENWREASKDADAAAAENARAQEAVNEHITENPESVEGTGREKLADASAQQTDIERSKAELARLERERESKRRLARTAQHGANSTSVPILGAHPDAVARAGRMEGEKRDAERKVTAKEKEIAIDEAGLEGRVDALKQANRANRRRKRAENRAARRAARRNRS